MTAGSGSEAGGQSGSGEAESQTSGEDRCRVTGGVTSRAANEGYANVREDFKITEKAPTRACASSFTFTIDLRHYAKHDK